VWVAYQEGEQAGGGKRTGGGGGGKNRIIDPSIQTQVEPEDLVSTSFDRRPTRYIEIPHQRKRTVAVGQFEVSAHVE
jgi:hypothetical protein